MEKESVKKLAPTSLSGFDIVEYVTNLNDEVEWMCSGFITDPSITMIYATDGIGKSLIGIQTALELASGFPVFKTLHSERAFKIIYVMAERSIKEPMKRIKNMLGDPDYNGKINFLNLAVTTEFQGKDLSNPKNSEALLGVLKRHAKDIGGCDILIFDPLYALVKGDLKEDQPINAVFNFFRMASSELGANIMFFHHENRGQKEPGAKERTGQDYYGNKFISGLCTSVYHMIKEKGDNSKTVLINEKDTESCLIPRITLSYNPEFNTVCGDINSSPKAKKIIIESFLKKCSEENKPFSQDDFFKFTGIHGHINSKRRIIAKLCQEKRIKNLNNSGIEGLYVALTHNP